MSPRRLKHPWLALWGLGLAAACRFTSSLDGYEGDPPERWHNAGGERSDAANDSSNDAALRDGARSDSTADGSIASEDAKNETTACPEGKGDCDDTPGCETDLMGDPNHCGSCERTCYGGTCATGTCSPVEFLSAQNRPWAVVADSTGVYWSIQPSLGKWTIRFLSAGAPAASARTVLDLKPIVPDFAANSSTVYSIDAASSVVFQIANTGTNRFDISHGSAPNSLATDGEWVFWTDAYPNSCTVCKARPDGTGSSGLVGSSPGARGITLDESNVYWFEEQSSTWMIMSISKSMGLSTVVSKGLRSPTDLLVTQSTVYWTEAGSNVSFQNESGAMVPRCKTSDGTVKKLDKGAGSPTVVASGLKCPFRMVAAGPNLYWTNTGLEDRIGSVMSVGLNDGEPVVVAEDQPAPRGIAADSTTVYWVNEGMGTSDGTMVRLAW